LATCPIKVVLSSKGGNREVAKEGITGYLKQIRVSIEGKGEKNFGGISATSRKYQGKAIITKKKRRGKAGLLGTRGSQLKRLERESRVILIDKIAVKCSTIISRGRA